MHRRMVEAEISPDYITLNVLLNSLCNFNRVALGFSVMGGILKRGIVLVLLLLLH